MISTKNPDKLNPNTPDQRRLIDVIGAGDPKLSAATARRKLDRWGNNTLAGSRLRRGGTWQRTRRCRIWQAVTSTGAGGVSATAGLTALAAGPCR